MYSEAQSVPEDVAEVRVLTVIDSLGFGGAELLLLSLLPKMRLKGVLCEVAVLQPPLALAEELERRGITVHRIGLRHRWLFPVAIYKIWRLCANRRFHALWGHLFFGNLYATAVAAILRLRMVWTIHYPAPLATASSGVWKRQRALLERYSGTRADVRVGVSDAIRVEYGRAWGWNVQTIHNGVDLEELSSPMTRGEYRTMRERPQDEFVVAVVARYAPEKGQEVLLSALRVLRSQHAWLPKCLMVGEIGDGVYKRKLESIAEMLDLGAAVEMSGAVAHKEAIDLLNASDLAVFPSLREPFGIAAAEAMALGRPCILSDTDGFREIVADSGSAVLVPPGDAAALAQAIFELWRRVDVRDALANRAKSRIAKSFDVRQCVEKWCGIFRAFAPSRSERDSGTQ